MKQSWARRMSPAVRIAFLVILSLALVFVVGVLVGFAVGMAEHGRAPHKPLAYVFLATILAAGAAIVWVMTTIVRSWRDDGMSAFDKRYWKMWLLIVLLSIPVGFGLVMVGVVDRPPGLLNRAFETMSPGGAIAATLGFLLLMCVAAWLYHRAIDDHEERAFLWGSQIAYYFVALALPALWLLSRGGLIAPPDFADAISLILVSFLVQAAVWAWFKFR